ncbi:MAG TPA: hypothetical protein VHV78_03545 [Gemmatimonadaceae bacterium]|nr:hypothetical protein [Gemmatimonadaceae bacterium]
MRRIHGGSQQQSRRWQQRIEQCVEWIEQRLGRFLEGIEERRHERLRAGRSERLAKRLLVGKSGRIAKRLVAGQSERLAKRLRQLER